MTFHHPYRLRFLSSTFFLVMGIAFLMGVLVACGGSDHVDTSAPNTRPPAAEGTASATPTNQETKESTMPANPISVKVFNKEGKLVGPVTTSKVIKTDAQWQKILTPEQYEIVRAKGTERPFCGTLLDNHKEGVYTCVACGLPLFSSDSKFHSGTGWPSFFQPIAKENITEIADRSLGMLRTEIECARCGGHLGHVFDDGPRPTGMRYCLNSESLNFTPSDQLAKLADPAAEAPAPTTAPAASAAPVVAKEAVAVLAGGCFWCTEAVYEQLKGVKSVEPGYAGGKESTANYETVSTGTTGHAESIRIVYDPTVVSYTELLHVFFTVAHDPTQLNAQGADEGTQYRSAIFYADEVQRKTAESYIKLLNDQHTFSGPIVTTLEPLKGFYPAEAYHHGYARKHPNQPYIQGVAEPKVDKLYAKFGDKVKSADELPPTK